MQQGPTQVDQLACAQDCHAMHVCQPNALPDLGSDVFRSEPNSQSASEGTSPVNEPQLGPEIPDVESSQVSTQAPANLSVLKPNRRPTDCRGLRSKPCSQLRLDFGEHQTKTFEEAVQLDPSWTRWMADHMATSAKTPTKPSCSMWRSW